MGSVFGKFKKNEEQQVVVKKAKADPQQPYFRMPLHYPRYRKADYETMPEEIVDRLLQEYGLPVKGTLTEKRDFAIGAFIFPEQSGAEGKEENQSMEKCSLTEPNPTTKTFDDN